MLGIGAVGCGGATRGPAGPHDAWTGVADADILRAVGAPAAGASLVRRDSVPERGEFAWIRVGITSGYCPTDHELLAHLRLDHGRVRLLSVTPIDLGCWQEPNLEAVAFPDDRGLVIVNRTATEGSAAETRELWRVDADALVRIGGFDADRGDGRPEDGLERTIRVRADYTATTVTAHERIVQSECPERTQESCHVVSDVETSRVLAVGGRWTH
jgi:hypothetical protein